MSPNTLLAACIVFSIELATISATPEDTNVLHKRSDVDLKTCIDNFALHKDKIIRTQDSRTMGAKYLNEIDLDTREECLRLCCETDNCDVFIYEEKKVGSCYLFQCGPPEDFKCKFTHHVNYSSGVLTVNRHLPDLVSQIKLTKHEEDLTKLRKPEVPSPDSVPIAVDVKITTTTATTTVKSRELLDAKPESGKCKRFQFECRSTRECIAIYNACDGIPQCSDGSDEAPELGCPQDTSTTFSPANIPPQVSKVKETEVPRITQSANTQNQEQPYRPPIQRQTSQAASSSSQEDFIRPPMTEQRIALNNQPEPQQVPQFPQYPVQPQNWMPRQAMPQQPQYDKNSHIFNHKGSGLQVPEGLETRYNKYKGAMQTLHRALGYSSPMQQYGDINTHEYQKIPPYYGEVYRQPMQQISETWPRNAAEENYRSNPYPLEVNPRESWHRNVFPSEQNEQQMSAKPHQDYTQNQFFEKPEENPTHVQNKMAHELKQHSKEQLEIKNTSAKQVKIDKNLPNIEERDHDKYAVAGVAERLEIKDGLAEAPGGAILSLTLGLIITCLMAILIGCRLRVVRRRMRRGGKSYAHDADYLVNGMYL